MVSKDLVAACSRPLILSILAREESYGYAILQEVKRLSRSALAWTDGMLYPVLHRLERDGLVQSSWRTPDSGRRRRYYRLTGRGKRSLNVERQNWLAVHRTLTLAWRTMSCSS